MTRDRIITADASQVSGADFFRAVFGKPALTEQERAEKRRQADAYWAERNEQTRREIEGIRDRLCEMVSPELAAEWRTKWAREDAERDERERRRAA